MSHLRRNGMQAPLPYARFETGIRIRLEKSALLGNVVWWGFYGGNFIEVEEPPPMTQEFRMRIYQAREGDGLPGALHTERVFNNPIYEPTGRPVLTSVFPPEFRFEASFEDPVLLVAETTYWLEITQVGDESSHYRWIISQSEQNSYAFQNAARPNWALSGLGADLAYQLKAIPEPSTALFLMTLFSSSLARRRRRK